MIKPETRMAIKEAADAVEQVGEQHKVVSLFLSLGNRGLWKWELQEKTIPALIKELDKELESRRKK